ncbi:MAG: hypothetical protein ACFCVD_10570 [Nodosilinea sp.]
MVEALVVFSVVLYLFTRDVFSKPKKKTEEEILGEALVKYLKEGVQVRIKS